MSEFTELYDKIGYTFADEKLLFRALTHPSFNAHDHYQRLEFLGDSIVDYAVSDLLYHNSNEREGAMTDTRKLMVSMQPLAYLSDLLGLSKLCRKKNCALSVKMKSDLYEALTAAIALDSGIDQAVAFVKRTITLAPLATQDFKTKLKEYCEKKRNSYRTACKTNGIGAKQIFIIEVYVDDNCLGVGKNANKHKAENEACRLALSSLKLI